MVDREGGEREREGMNVVPNDFIIKFSLWKIELENEWSSIWKYAKIIYQYELKNQMVIRIKRVVGRTYINMRSCKCVCVCVFDQRVWILSSSSLSQGMRLVKQIEQIFTDLCELQICRDKSVHPLSCSYSYLLSLSLAFHVTPVLS